MNRFIRIAALASMLFLLPSVILVAQGEITLEGVAEALSTLSNRVDANNRRIAALETLTAPTPTPEATATATPVPEPETVLVVTIARGNVRDGPGTQHAVVGAVSKDQILTGPYQEQAGWYEFCCVNDDQKAWISSTLVSVMEIGEISAWQEARNAAVEINRNDLIRNNESHIGKWVYFGDASVVQALDDGMIVNRMDDGIGKTLILTYPHTPLRIIQGDTIEFVAEVIGVYTYESISLGMITSPVLRVVELRIQE